MKTQIRFTLYLLILIIMVNTGCRRDDEIKPFDSSGSSSQKVSGRVVDESGNGISGATVVSNGKTATTGNFGQFTINNISASDRVVVKCEHNGYFTGTATEIPSSSGNTFVQITLQQAAVTQTLSSSTGGTATLSNGSSVNIPASGVVDENGNAYSGNVSVSVAHLDPTSADFGKLTQGSDMQAVEQDGDKVTLYSYGVLRVELADNAGNELQLASGKESTIRMPIPASMLASAPATIPLWYFDEEAGIWKEEGEATKIGSEYVGTVKHFTDWNCDYPSANQSTLTGTVLDCNNEPMPNIGIRLGQTYAYTNSEGKFGRRVPSGVDIACKIEPLYNYGLASNTYNVSALSPGQTYDCGNIVLTTCPSFVTGRITDCNNNAVSGWLTINSGPVNYIYSDNGEFKARVATSTNVEVTAYSDNGGFKSATITTSANMGDLNDVGDIQVCAPTIGIGENSFTITGDGFTAENIVLNITNYNFNPMINDKEYAVGSLLDSNGVDTLDNRIRLASVGKFGQNDSAIAKISLYAGLIHPGTYSFNGNNFMQISTTAPNGTWDYDYQSESGTFTITKIDVVGGLIEGTFSGTFYKYNDQLHANPITITNGKFSMVRMPDNTYNF